MTAKSPKFYCESCGSEVRQNAKLCPHCGKFFASVKCPACGFSGDSRIFRDGCPACGYAFTTTPAGKSPPSRDKKKEGDDPLPWWIYLVSILMLAGIVLLILIRR